MVAPRGHAKAAKVAKVANVALALPGFSALVTEVATLVERGQLQVGDFLSRFTVECNAFAVVSRVIAVVVAGSTWLVTRAPARRS